MKKAVKSAAEFNSQFMREKREERRAYFDLQTRVNLPLNMYLIKVYTMSFCDLCWKAFGDTEIYKETHFYIALRIHVWNINGHTPWMGHKNRLL